MKSVGAAAWQCVLIAWGDRYPVAEINALVATIRTRSRGPERFVLLSDRPRPGLADGVELRPMPVWALDADLLGPGCQAKLCMFERGVLPDDLPTVYLDLDTMVLGDISILLTVLQGPQSIALLQSAILPFGTVSRWLFRVTRGQRYARGNSSIVLFHPAHSDYVATRFLMSRPAFATSGQNTGRKG